MSNIKADQMYQSAINDCICELYCQYLTKMEQKMKELGYDNEIWSRCEKMMTENFNLNFDAIKMGLEKIREQ